MSNQLMPKPITDQRAAELRRYAEEAATAAFTRVIIDGDELLWLLDLRVERSRLVAIIEEEIQKEIDSDFVNPVTIAPSQVRAIAQSVIERLSPAPHHNED